MTHGAPCADSGHPGHGLATVEAGSGAEALAVLEREGEIPLCISDMHMPEMDGVTFLREALRRYPDMAVIMLTGVAEVNTAVECLQLGALDYISKPVMIEEVRARVDKALEKRQLVLQNRFYQQNLEGRVRELDRRNKESLINGVQTLVHALEAKDAYTSGHSAGSAAYAVKTAVHAGLHRRAAGAHPARRRAARHRQDRHPRGDPEQARPAHARRSSSTSRSTPLLGEKILAPFLNESPMVLRIVRSHHERMDGSGFPDALQRRPDSAWRPASWRWWTPSMR